MTQSHNSKIRIGGFFNSGKIANALISIGVTQSQFFKKRPTQEEIRKAELEAIYLIVKCPIVSSSRYGRKN